MDLELLREQFCDHALYMRGCSPATIKRYRTAVQLFRRQVNVSELSDCTPTKVREFFFCGRAKRNWAPSTFVTYHKALLVFFRWCVKNSHLGENPADGIELPKIPKALPKSLPLHEAQRLLEMVRNYPWPYTFQRHRNTAILATVIYAGLRKQELLGLGVADVDLQDRSILVRRGKGLKDRIVPMNVALVPTLSKYADERRRLGKTCPEFFTSLNRNMRLTDMGLRGLVRQVKAATNLRFSLHSLRHTFATLMLEGGCDIFALSRMMGHSEIKTQTLYLAATPQHLRGEMAKHPLC